MRALIITSQLVQDHEFIYPFYRLKEENFDVDVYNQSNEIVKGFFGTKIPREKKKHKPINTSPNLKPKSVKPTKDLAKIIEKNINEK